MKIRAGLVAELGVNLLRPWLAYRLALPHWGELGALYASAVPPIVWSLAEFARTLVLLGIAMSIVLMALGGSPRLLLMCKSMASGAIGVVFLLSLAMRRPLPFISCAQPSPVKRKVAQNASKRSGTSGHSCVDRFA